MSAIVWDMRFEQGQGPSALEAVSNRRVHIAHGPSSPPCVRRGVTGGALAFDGYTTWLRDDASGLALGPAFSLEAWIAPRALEHGHGGKLTAIVEQYDAAARRGFQFGLGRHGHWGLRIGDGGQVVELLDGDAPVPRNAWSHVVASVDGAAGEARLHLDGRPAGVLALPAGFRVRQAAADLMVGRTADNDLAHGHFNLNTFAGLIGRVTIHGEALSDRQVAEVYRSAVSPHGGAAPPVAAGDIGLDPARYAEDPHRPRYHAIVPGHWMNEPHAPFWFNGRYHLFCQFNPFGPFFHELRWGHWTSPDLVRWSFVGEALTQDEALSPDGVWSGSATHDRDGAPVLFFTIADRRRKPDQAIGLARPADPTDPQLRNWIRHTAPVLEQDPSLGLSNDFRDPFVWRDAELDCWFMLVGSSQAGRGCAQIYGSDDLVRWNHLGDFFAYDPAEYPFLGPIWELPVLLPVGHYPDGETRWVFIVSPVGPGADVEVFYWLGRLDRSAFRFVADRPEPRLIDYGDFHFTGPSGIVNPATGRAILFTIAQGDRSLDEEHDAGWAHNAGLPVVLSLDEAGELRVEPIGELAALREATLVDLRNVPADVADRALAKVSGPMLEVLVEFEARDAAGFGLELGCSPDGRERTRLAYEPQAGRLSLDRTRTSLARDNGVRGGPVALENGVLSLQVFLDHSMVEVYANRRQSLTSRLYPTLPAATGLRLWAEGEVTVRSLTVWQLSAT